MTTPVHSMSTTYIAKYDSYVDAMKATKMAHDRDIHGKYEYVASFSNHAQRWLVAVHDRHGNLKGFLHPILS